MKSRLALGALALALATAGLPVAAAEDMLPLVIQPDRLIMQRDGAELTYMEEEAGSAQK